MWNCIGSTFRALLPVNLDIWTLGILIGCIIVAIASLIPGGPAATLVLAGCLATVGITLGVSALVALLGALIECF